MCAEYKGKERRGREAVAPEWERRWWLSATIENVAVFRKKKATRVFPGKQKETPRMVLLRQEKTTKENKARECEMSIWKVSRLVPGRG